MSNNYSEKTYNQILNDMCERVTKCSTIEGSFIYTALAPFAMELAMLYFCLSLDDKNSFADTADYEHLKRIAGDRGLTPKTATFAEGIGAFNVEIPIGSRFSLNNYVWVSSDFILEDENYKYYKMTCETAGSAPNTLTGRLTPVSFIQDLSYANLNQITVPGENDEEVEDFRARYYASFNKKSFGGNKDDYIEKCNSFDGVGGTKVHPLWNGNGTVKCVLINSDFDEPSHILIDDIQIAIDPQRDGKGDGYAPIGHQVTIAGASHFDITVGLSLTLSSGYTFDSIKENLKNAIKTYFLSLNKQWAESDHITVRVAQVQSTILNVDGVVDVINCELNNQTGNLDLNSDEIANLLDVVEI